ncbi:MAG TPA: YIP1 family protein [Vicinamibacterales bacterium]|nr:YIP1 family protein [Vicinamibacterales bacterium]
MSLFFYRLMGAAMLDRSMYEGIEADRSLTGQAALAVVLSSLAAGFGAGGWFTGDLQMFVTVTGLALVTWAAWAVLMHQIGTRMLPEPQTRATLGELLRTVGFAAAPGLFQIFAIFPVVTIPVFVVSIAWMFAAMVIGVRHALDYSSSWRALAVCGVAFSLVLVLAFVIGVLFGPTVS